MRDVNELLMEAKRRDLQDFFLTGDDRPYGYAAKTLDDSFGAPVPNSALEEFLRRLFSDREDNHWRSALNDGGSYVFMVTGPWGRARVNVAKIGDKTGTSSRLGFSIRFLLDEVLPLSELDVPVPYELLAAARSGLILLTGITGDGKSTLGASMLDHFARELGIRCLSIGQPIEYLSTTPLWWQREVNFHTRSFLSGTVDAMQQRPRVIDISEVKTRDVAEGMFDAAESGHLTVATLHVNTPEEAPDRLSAMFDFSRFPNYMLSSKGVMIIGVRLARVTEAYAEKTGRKLRAIVEVIPFTTAIRNAIRNGSSADQLRQHVTNPTDRNAPFMSFERHAALLGETVIPKDEALSIVPDPELYARLLAQGRAA
jgi:Tfp pilus assembly pilus retraction ATPase PilT